MESAAFTVAGQATSALEAVAFVTGLVSVWLTQRMHVGNWPAGIVSVACFAWLFFEAKLYAAASLQLVFIVLCVYGWWHWARASRTGGEGLPASHATRTEMIVGGVLAAVATAACAWLLQARTDSPAPWADAAVLAFSLLATWAQARRRIESWWVWIAVDVVSIPLYWSRDLPLTAALYVIFLAICVYGLHTWSQRLQPAAVEA